MSERFTLDEFEEALPRYRKTGEQAWRYLGFFSGERVYAIYVPNTNKRIVIRSSVNNWGIAARTGENSIRHWVEYRYKGKWFPLTKGRKKYTTRIKGWQDRMKNTILELWESALKDSRRRRKG